MKDLLEDNWAYREMVKWAEEKSFEQGKKKILKQTVVRFVKACFPSLTSLAEQQAALATTSQQLQEILDQLFVARTDNEAEAALLSKK